MEREKVLVSAEETARQKEYMDKVRALHERRTTKPLAYVHTYGCQQNVADGERLMGMLREMGCEFTDDTKRADIVLMNTCAIRENAEKTVYGMLGQLTHTKAANPDQIICLCGCMAQQPRVAEKVKTSYRHVDLVLGPQAEWRFPELLYRAYTERGRVFSIDDEPGRIAEDIPVYRAGGVSAWVSIMYGCNNFCSYCIVPYVRGREKSRPLEDIVAEAERYVAAGVKEITLLGQNVNSYGRDLYGEPRFADVLRAVDAAGIERLRFATSHPKDLTDEVIGLFATLPSLMPALHLPVQSGSNRILSAMNRRYTREHYLGLIEKLRRARPDIALSTDIIVGFPGETEEDFMDTYRLVEEVGYSQVFTFIYSKREGTPAAEMDDDTPREVIQERFDRLVDLVQRKAFEANQAELGATVPVLVEGTSKRDDSILAGKSPKNQTVHAPVPAGADAASLVGRIVPVTIEEARTWYLSGTIVHA